MIGTQPRSFPVQSALLGLTLLAGHTPRSDGRTVRANILLTTEGSGQSLECSAPDLWPRRTNCASHRILPQVTWSVVIFIKQEASIETTSPIYSEAGILQTLYQQWVGEAKEISFLFANNQYWALKAKQNSRKLPSNSMSSASSRVQRLH